MSKSSTRTVMNRPRKYWLKWRKGLLGVLAAVLTGVLISVGTTSANRIITHHQRCRRKETIAGQCDGGG